MECVESYEKKKDIQLKVWSSVSKLGHFSFQLTVKCCSHRGYNRAPWHSVFTFTPHPKYQALENSHCLFIGSLLAPHALKHIQHPFLWISLAPSWWLSDGILGYPPSTRTFRKQVKCCLRIQYLLNNVSPFYIRIYSKNLDPPMLNITSEITENTDKWQDLSSFARGWRLMLDMVDIIVHTQGNSWLSNTPF